MNFIADLHIHSRFSRATSKQLSPRHLAAWARCKGIHVLGTGDFTHPQWRDELRQQLVRDEASGLYRLSGPAEELDFLQGRTPPDAGGPLFLLQTEISSIYKRQGRVRKVHNLIFVPSLDDADRLSRRLEAVGNLHSDGRPILGLDSRDLLEMTLEVCPEAVLVPAHVWTPWFALFGSKSGFDRLEDCFDDLSSHIFALETGLSSDPGMNRMVSRLDGYALISNSDAHSGANLGREANFFAGAPSYDGIFSALRAAARRLPPDEQPGDCRFLGTMEFYPEEGKYHLDGHRACNVVLEPREALALDNICPVCGKPLTIGVLHRVCELADRDAPASLPHEPEARPLIPLPELVGEILGAGSGSRKVQDRYASLLRELGPDLDILCRMELDEVRRHWEPLGEAVARMRRGQVMRKGGYDGEYGVVRVFSPEEAAGLQSGARGSLLAGTAPRKRGRPKKVADPAPQAPEREAATAVAAIRVRRKKDGDAPAESEPEPAAPDGRTLEGFSPAQAEALTAGLDTGTPVLVLAGPGAGKTRVLVGRLQYLLARGVPAARLLAVTFTRRAAQEMRQRLQARADAAPPAAAAGPAPVTEPAAGAGLPRCDTLHALAWSVVQRELPTALLLPEDAARALFVDAGHPESREEGKALRRLWDRLQWAREQGLPADGLPDDLRAAVGDWQAARSLRSRSPLLDYADLLEFFLYHLRLLRGEDIRPELEHSLLPPACRALLADRAVQACREAADKVSPAPRLPVSPASPADTADTGDAAGMTATGPAPRAATHGPNEPGEPGRTESADGTDRLPAPPSGRPVPRQMSLLGMVAPGPAAPLPRQTAPGQRPPAQALTGRTAAAPAPEAARRTQDLPWRHVLVDEVQDLSPIQLRLIRALLPEDGKGFFGIGDPDQAIYGFRGASGQSEDSLRALWPALRVCRLGQSYRASQGVLDMAQSLLQGRGHCGALQAMRQEEARLHLFSAPDQQAEARWVAARIRRLLGATAHTLMDQLRQEDELAGNLSPADVAVLVRLKAQIPVIRHALEQEGIPCAAPAQEDCWQDPLCGAVLRLAVARGQGEAPARAAPAADSEDLLPLLESVLALPPEAPLPDPQALQARLSGHSRLPAPLWQGAAWKRLCRLWQDCGQWEALVRQLGLQHEAELIRARSEQVQILTLHASKGLEFQAVFLPGLEEGLLPLRRELIFGAPDEDMSAAAQAGRLEEERRLFYVGLTRAARALYVSYSARRRLFGQELALEPSGFLPLVRRFCRQSTLARHTRAVREHLSLF